MSQIITQALSTAFGELILGSFNEELCLCDWRYRKMRPSIDARLQRGLNASYEEGSSPVIESAISQLQEYFLGERTAFELPLNLVGTDFQRNVWRALQQVPYGNTWSYSELRFKVADQTAVRAVASANGANAMSIIIPCHRIIGSTGELVGYAGGLHAKQKLLELEGALPKALDLFSTLAAN